MTATTEKVGSAVFWSLLGRGGRFVLGLVSSVIVVRGLGEYNYGVLSLLRTVLTFVVVIAGLGLAQSVLRFLPEMRVAGDTRSARRLVVRVMGMQVAAWAILALVAVGASGLFERVFGFEGVATLFVATVALAVFELSFGLFGNVLNAHYDTKLTAAAGVASHAVFIVLLLMFLPRGYGVLGVLVATAAGQAVACGMILPRVRRVLSGNGAAHAGVAGQRLFRLSWPFAVIGLLHLIVWRQSETLFLAHYRTAQETGFFDLAYRLPQTILEFVPGTIWPIIMAGFSEAFARDADSLKRVIVKYYRMLFLLSTPICLMGIALGGRLVPMLFGEAMAPAAVPTQVFFGVFTVSFLATPLSMTLYVLEKPHFNLVVNAVFAVVNVGLDLLLIPRFGIVGAVIPVALVVCLSPIIYKRILDRFVIGLGIPFRFIGKCVVASTPALLILVIGTVVESDRWVVLAAVPVIVMIAFFTKWLKLIGKEESDMLVSIPIPAVGRLLKFFSI